MVELTEPGAVLLTHARPALEGPARTPRRRGGRRARDRAGRRAPVRPAVEPYVAALPAGHPLAGAGRVRLADLAVAPADVHERVERDIGEHGVEGLAQLLALIGLGRTTTVLPRSVAAR